MSTNASTTPESADTDEPPTLGARDNWWGEDQDDGADADAGGHDEVGGTDAAEWVAYQQLLDLVAPVCERTGIELSEPTLYLPKQHAVAGGSIEYRQHRHRRRVNPETGYINWGETTSTDVPEFDEETYEVAVHNYLANRLAGQDLRVTQIEAYLEHANALWHDPQYDAFGSLEQFVRYVRDEEAGAE